MIIEFMRKGLIAYLTADSWFSLILPLLLIFAISWSAIDVKIGDTKEFKRELVACEREVETYKRILEYKGGQNER